MEVGYLILQGAERLLLIHLICRKHVDRHDRPYKCETPGCKKQQGFTNPYSLSRHQREVHKIQGLTKVFCPIENCRRSSGSGFTRKQNRDEHVRRLHRIDTDGAASLTTQDTVSKETTMPFLEPHTSHQARNKSIDITGVSESNPLSIIGTRLQFSVQTEQGD
jgi:hypothetical protein